MYLVVLSLNALSGKLVTYMTNVFLATTLNVLQARWILHSSPVPIRKYTAFRFPGGEGHLFICPDVGEGVYLGFAYLDNTVSSLISS